LIVVRAQNAAAAQSLRNVTTERDKRDFLRRPEIRCLIV
jgi:hypothetical protein